MNKKIVSIFLCMLMLTVVSSAAMNVNISEENEDEILLLVRIDLSENQAILPSDLDIVGTAPGEWIEVIVTENELQELSNLGIEYEIIIDDVIAYDNSVRGQYHTLAEAEAILADIANDHPDITDLYIVGTTYEGRDIWCLEISDNPGVDEGEPGVFLMGLHHAREWPTLEITLNICEELTSGYSSLVNSLRMWVIPCVNPDGYYYCHDQGHDWRKNRHPYPGGIGVDLNRNYAGSSNGDPYGAWGSVGDGVISNNPSSEVYCGPAPFSEVETQAVRDIFLENDIHATISWHTHGQLVMWPWGHTPNSAPDSSYLAQVGQQIASKITRQSGSGTYTPQQSCGLYPTTGDTTDWAYGFGHYVQGRPTFAYTIEACSSFHPPAGYLDQIIAENFDGALEMLNEAEDIRDTVALRVLPPTIDEMETDIDGDYTVSWEEQNPDADPSKFQLDELIGPSIKTDDAESGSGYWSIDGFSESTARYHSSSHSYKSGSGNNKIYSMTTVDPVPIATGMELDFWCWYDLEYDYDMAFVEVSLNGRSYDVLDTFTGSSSNWEHMQYSLDDYAGESLFIRFRYTTDDYTLEEGFYVDDISPMVEWNSITTLSDSITSNSYEITGKDNGIYYYRVKGYNSERDWCDFSTLEDMEVEIFLNDPPATPNIVGPPSGQVGQAYEYTFITTDPDGDQVYYYIEWGDGDIVDWDGPYDSGEELTLAHTWNEEGTFIIKAKAKDIYDYESQFETFEVTMTKSRSLMNLLIQRLQDIFKFLQYFLIKLR
ncbi:MAG: immune inhibitor A [Thermoplasmatales archaeon]|nr:immune inhibitor A [Thermoplasmatales archaeon]